MTSQVHSPLERSAQPAGQRGYSLAELLTVIAIISILGALTLPSVMGVSSSRQLTNGGSMVMDLANQARQNASSRGVLTALVLVKDVPNHADANNRLLILLELAQGENGAAPAWQPVSKWVLLPANVMVDASQSSFTQASYQATLPQALPTVSYLGAPLALTSANSTYQIFTPAGQLDVKGFSVMQPPTLRMALAKNGTLLPEKNYYQISFNLYTGYPIVARP